MLIHNLHESYSLDTLFILYVLVGELVILRFKDTNLVATLFFSYIASCVSVAENYPDIPIGAGQCC